MLRWSNYKAILIIFLIGLLAWPVYAQLSSQDQIAQTSAAYTAAQKTYQDVVKHYGAGSPQAQAAARVMTDAAKVRNDAIRGGVSSTTKSTSDIIIDNGEAAALRQAGLRHQICATCAVFNVFDAYFAGFAKDAFVIIGNSVTVLVFGFAVGLGILRYALFRIAPRKDAPPAVDLMQLLTFIAAVAALRSADSIVWRTYEAFLDWGASVAVELMSKGAGGAMTIPAAAKSPLAKIVGGAEDLLWGFVGFAFETLRAPNFIDALTSGPGAIAASIVFSVLVLAIYGGLLLYFSYFILQGYIFLLLPVPFGSLIVGAAAFKETRQTTIEAIKLVIFALGTFIGSGLAMGFTARVLGLSKAVVSCYTVNRNATSCGAQIKPLASALGVPEGSLTEAFSSFEIFSVLIILGICCWLVHFLTMHVVAKLLNVSPMGGPLAVAAGATAAAIYKGGSHFFGGFKAASVRNSKLTQGIGEELTGRSSARTGDPLRMT